MDKRPELNKLDAIKFKTKEIKALNSPQYINCYLVNGNEELIVKCKKRIRDYYKK